MSHELCIPNSALQLPTKCESLIEVQETSNHSEIVLSFQFKNHNMFSFFRIRRVKISLLLVTVLALACILAEFTLVYRDQTQRTDFKLRSLPSAAADLGLLVAPVHHIYFLKTHKTASSTVTNILIRYGDTRNLAFVLPRQILTPFNWPQRFHLDNAYPLYSGEPNILCSHARHSHEALSQLFPKPKAKYITIIRNPAENFKSSFAFFNMTKLMGLENSSCPVTAFLRKPEEFKDVRDWRNIPLRYRVRNPMLFDTGLDHKYFHNKTAVKEYIEFIDQEFDLVMVADYFDESLILLKRLLRWNNEDIVYIKHNVALRVRGKLKETFDEKLKKQILDWNWADSLLFDHFNRTLWRKIQYIGPKFFDDLETFRSLNNRYQDLCKLMKKYAEKTQNHKLRLRKTCIQMKKDNRKFYHEKITEFMG